MFCKSRTPRPVIRILNFLRRFSSRRSPLVTTSCNLLYSVLCDVANKTLFCNHWTLVVFCTSYILVLDFYLSFFSAFLFLFGRPEWNRTIVSALSEPCSAIELQVCFFLWWTCRDSNSDLPSCKDDALPLSYKPTYLFCWPYVYLIIKEDKRGAGYDPTSPPRWRYSHN